MTEHAVVIAGGDPTGMMLAAELALRGSTSRSLSVDPTTCWLGRAQEAFTHARSRCSINAASPTGFLPRARSPRLR